MKASHKMSGIALVHLHKISRICKSIEKGSRLIGRDWGKGEQGVTANDYGISFGNDENLLEIVVMVAQLYEYSKNS